eukprot:1556332-Amphidinium_carterae.3
MPPVESLKALVSYTMTDQVDKLDIHWWLRCTTSYEHTSTECVLGMSKLQAAAAEAVENCRTASNCVSQWYDACAVLGRRQKAGALLEWSTAVCTKVRCAEAALPAFVDRLGWRPSDQTDAAPQGCCYYEENPTATQLIDNSPSGACVVARTLESPSRPAVASGDLVAHRLVERSSSGDEQMRRGVGKNARHIQTRLLWLQERVAAKHLHAKKVHTDANTADVLTKALPTRSQNQGIVQSSRAGLALH